MMNIAEEDTKQKLSVMNAFLNGAKIEVVTRSAYVKFTANPDWTLHWQECPRPGWDWINYVYRVKPKVQQPKYVLWRGPKDLPTYNGLWLRRKGNNENVFLVTMVTETHLYRGSVSIAFAEIGSYEYSLAPHNPKGWYDCTKYVAPTS